MFTSHCLALRRKIWGKKLPCFFRLFLGEERQRPPKIISVEFVLQIISIFAAHLTGKVKRSKQSKNHRNVMFFSGEKITMCFNYIYNTNTEKEEVYWLLRNIIRCEMWQSSSFHFCCRLGRLGNLHFYSMFIDIMENMEIPGKYCGERRYEAAVNRSKSNNTFVFLS